jgi:hypothetical protein
MERETELPGREDPGHFPFAYLKYYCPSLWSFLAPLEQTPGPSVLVIQNELRSLIPTYLLNYLVRIMHEAKFVLLTLVTSVMIVLLVMTGS